VAHLGIILVVALELVDLVETIRVLPQLVVLL
jgi:hypothetical protein